MLLVRSFVCFPSSALVVYDHPSESDPRKRIRLILEESIKREKNSHLRNLKQVEWLHVLDKKLSVLCFHSKEAKEAAEATRAKGMQRTSAETTAAPSATWASTAASTPMDVTAASSPFASTSALASAAASASTPASSNGAAAAAAVATASLNLAAPVGAISVKEGAIVLSSISSTACDAKKAARLVSVPTASISHPPSLRACDSTCV